MAKIGDLQVETLKIANNAFTEFFYPYTGGAGTNRNIDITYDSLNIPVMIWVQVGTPTLGVYVTLSGTPTLIYTFGEYTRTVISDIRSAGTYTYALLGGGSGTFTGAMKRLK